MRTGGLDDISDAVMRLQAAFRAYGMEPAIITLSCSEDGDRFRQLVAQYTDEVCHSQPAFDEKGVPVTQIELRGTIIRWLTQKRTMPFGFKFR